MCVKGNQQRSDKLNMRLNSVKSREIVGNQDLKKVHSDGYWEKLPNVVVQFLTATSGKQLCQN